MCKRFSLFPCCNALILLFHLWSRCSSHLHPSSDVEELLSHLQLQTRSLKENKLMHSKNRTFPLNSTHVSQVGQLCYHLARYELVDIVVFTWVIFHHVELASVDVTCIRLHQNYQLKQPIQHKAGCTEGTCAIRQPGM